MCIRDRCTAHDMYHPKQKRFQGPSLGELQQSDCSPDPKGNGGDSQPIRGTGLMTIPSGLEHEQLFNLASESKTFIITFPAKVITYNTQDNEYTRSQTAFRANPSGQQGESKRPSDAVCPWKDILEIY